MLEIPLKYVSLLKIRDSIYTLTGTSVLMFVNILLLFVDPSQISICILTALWFLFSIVNYYIYTFHGKPFTIGEIKNTGTALTVIGSYKFSIPWKRFLGLISAGAGFVICRMYFGRITLSKPELLITGAILLFVIYLLVFSPLSPVSKNGVTWSWGEALDKYGYVIVFIKTAAMELKPLKKPEGYERQKEIEFISDYRVSNGSKPDKRPDIIFILNETWFDLTRVMSIKANRDCFYHYRNLADSIRGYALAPQAGGGTNLSEYELLTTNSTSLMPLVTPFNVLDLKGSNSVVSYLKNIGYKTFATHIADGSTYSRSVAYPAMGFDVVKFRDEYVDLEFYGKRNLYPTDTSTFNNLFTWYEEYAKNEPLFMYCLTIQNHGDWKINGGEDNLISLEGYQGTDKDYLEEYLSCMFLTDQAFKGLTDRYKNSERDVVIMMTGDHSPSFVSNLAERKDRIDIQSTPFIIWANKPGILDEAMIKNDTMCMNLLAPSVFQVAGIKLSGYYDFLINMRDKNPVSDQIVSSVKGNKLYDRYQRLEYLNIKEPAEMRAFFNPPV